MKEKLKLKTKVKVANPVDISKFEELEVIIDTGASDVIFGEENDTELLGLLTLEGMASSVNTQTGELEEIELLLL